MQKRPNRKTDSANIELETIQAGLLGAFRILEGRHGLQLVLGPVHDRMIRVPFIFGCCRSHAAARSAGRC